MKKTKRRLTGDRDRDEILLQWPQMSFWEKLRYIFSYYGIAIVLVLVGILVAVFLIRNVRQNTIEDTFYVMVLGADGLEEDAIGELEEELADWLGLDAQTQECVIETSYTNTSNTQGEATISTYMRSGRVDLLIAAEEDFNLYATTGYLTELSEESYGEVSFFYAEQVDYSEGGAVTELPYHPHENTEDSAAYGIYLESGTFEGFVLGIMVNAPDKDGSYAGLEFFLSSGF